jgi:N-glycosylase/DNA lyase
MRIHLNPSCPFDLDATLCCGQAFRWDRKDEWWYGIVQEHTFKIRQIDDFLEFEGAPIDFVRNYFGLYDDLPKILSQITRDEHIEVAAKKFRGLRILRQDTWECLISYICATYKNIPAIKLMLLNLSRKFGDKVSYDGYDFYEFPKSENLAKASEKELAKCGLGYRAKYVSETAKMIFKNDFKVEHLRKMPYRRAREELLNFSGVGLKVADCISLFSLEKLEAFPVDVQIKRALVKYYANHFSREFVTKVSANRSPTNSEYEKLSSFGQKYFGEYAGYAQEYIYHYERTAI